MATSEEFKRAREASADYRTVPKAEQKMMPTGWTGRVRKAITTLEIKTTRVLAPDQALALIDDVVEGKLAADELAIIHTIPAAAVRATLTHVTMSAGTGQARSLEAGSWYAFRGHEHPYTVAPGFAAAWKKARGLL